MGCCGSRPTGPSSFYPDGAAPSASARAINTAAATTTTTNNATNMAISPAAASPRPGDRPPASMPTSPRSPQHRQRPPLDQPINKPLRRHRWTSGSRVWTREQLARERAEFFDTRVTGRAEVWLAIKAALEVLWDSDPHALPPPTQEQQEEALLTAQGILAAADVILPTGNLAQGVYDRLGNYYPLPEHVVSNPTNAINASDLPPSDIGDDVVVDQDDDDEEEEEIGSLGDSKQPFVSSSIDDESEMAAQRRREKGKSVEVQEETITVRCRLSNDAKDVVITLPKKSHVRFLSRMIIEEAKLPADTVIRIAYLGKILRDSSSLTSQGWKEGHVLNALCFSGPR